MFVMEPSSERSTSFTTMKLLGWRWENYHRKSTLMWRIMSKKRKHSKLFLHIMREDNPCMNIRKLLLFIVMCLSWAGGYVSDICLKVTCEVSPHHLFLTEDNEAKIGVGRSRVRPCLVSELDRQTLWENMDIIDCFATDHGKNQHIIAKPCSKYIY